MMSPETQGLVQRDAYRWEIPATYKPGMRVPGLIYADEPLVRQILEDQAVEQVANAATLPGVIRWAIAMPDIHWGYGFPIGGVAAMRLDDGVISPGAVGYDINCGVRLLATQLTDEEVRPRLAMLADRLFQNVPSGVGAHGRLRLTDAEILEVLRHGAAWAVRRGYGRSSDLGRIESAGTIPGAQPDHVSRRALSRGLDQLGTLGSGNHFLEIQRVEAIHDPRAARAFGLHIVYDVAHNMAKIEEHAVEGQRAQVCVHRKGATRGFPAGHPDVPAEYQEVGHPVLVPGDMGRYSYVLVGTPVAMAETFGSTPHGAGRLRSRSAAKRLLRGVDLVDVLARRGILVRAASRELLAEEASEAYKDVAEVVRASDGAGLTRTVARLQPLAVIKG